MNIIKCYFNVKKNIYELPLYHSPYFYAFLRKMVKEETFYQNIAIIPFTMGLTSLLKGEKFYCLFICYKENSKNTILNILYRFNDIDSENNIKISPLTLSLENFEVFDITHIVNTEIAAFAINNNSLTLSFFTPLRQKRPAEVRNKSHSFFDLEYFHSYPNCLNHLFSSQRLTNDAPEEIGKLTVEEANGFWIDVPYSKNKTIGGFCGDIKLKGNMSNNLINFFIKNQYNGIGKNKAFGFGFYLITESKNIFNDILSQKNILYKRIHSEDSLSDSILSLKNTAPGIDKIELKDVLAAKNEVISRLIKLLKKKEYEFQPLKTVSIKKSENDYRELKIPSMFDRIIEKSMMLTIEDSIDRQLSVAVYSYRKKLGVKKAVSTVQHSLRKGYSKSIKADIKKYFDSVNRNRLLNLINIFLRDKDFSSLFSKWVYNLDKENVKGIAQGSPISPLLSNLYLDYFDKELVRQKFILIRFGDDFLLMFKEGEYNDVLSLVKLILKPLELELNTEKIKFYGENEPVEFLGYSITRETIVKIKKSPSVEKKWEKLFEQDFIDGVPIYITKKDFGVYSDGANLVIKRDKTEKIEKIPWKMIKDITIVGRAFFSYGAVYRALYDKIPVFFINIMGQQVGTLQPELSLNEKFEKEQIAFLKNKENVMQFIKEIVSAKLHNSYILLKRNNIESVKLRELSAKVKQAENIDQIRGFEGIGAKMYFENFKNLVLPFEFNGRTYYPPQDRVNAMLSFGYTLIYNRIVFMLRKKGFNSFIGFFHKGRGNHHALASDLLEELRHISERLVLTIIHKKILTKDYFVCKDYNGKRAFYLTSDGFPVFIRQFEQIFRTVSSYSGKNISYYEYLDEMGDKLRRMLRMGIPYKAMYIR